jgi:hypothetical protein
VIPGGVGVSGMGCRPGLASSLEVSFSLPSGFSKSQLCHHNVIAITQIPIFARALSQLRRLPQHATRHTRSSKRSTNQAARQIVPFCEEVASA